MSATSVTGVVEQMLDHAAHGRWGALHEILAPDFEIVEPASLPYGGVHRGITGYVALMQAIGALFELEFDLHRVTAVGPCDVLLQMTVGFTARTSGASVTLPVLELVTVRDGHVTRSEIFVSDTAALLQVLTPRGPAPPHEHGHASATDRGEVLCEHHDPGDSDETPRRGIAGVNGLATSRPDRRPRRGLRPLSRGSRGPWPLLSEPGSRRPALTRLEELLDWADGPLATAEVALTVQTTIDAARDALHARGRAGRA